MSGEYGHLDAEKDEISLKELGENMRVLSDRVGIVEQLPKSMEKSIETIQTSIRRFDRDLSNPDDHSGRATTRKIAELALSKATLETRFDDLKEHGVIKAIKDDISKLDKSATSQLQGFTRQLEAIPNPKNMNTLLKESFAFSELNKKVEGIESDKGDLARLGREYQEQINDIAETYNGAAHPTGPEFDELTLDFEELKILHNDLVYLLIGYMIRENDTRGKEFMRGFLLRKTKAVEEHETDERTLG